MLGHGARIFKIGIVILKILFKCCITLPPPPPGGHLLFIANKSIFLIGGHSELDRSKGLIVAVLLQKQTVSCQLL